MTKEARRIKFKELMEKDMRIRLPPKAIKNVRTHQRMCMTQNLSRLILLM